MENRLLQLANDLAAKTSRNEVIWNITTATDQFALRTSGGTVIVDKYGMGAEYGISVLSHSAVKVGEARFHHGESGYQVIKSLYDAAYDKYHRVQETLDDVLREIEKPGRIGMSDDDLPF